MGAWWLTEAAQLAEGVEAAWHSEVGFIWTSPKHTHRLFLAWCEGPEAPGDGDEVRLNSIDTMKCALEANIRPVDSLHVAGRVYRYPADPQHRCNSANRQRLQSVHP